MSATAVAIVLLAAAGCGGSSEPTSDPTAPSSTSSASESTSPTPAVAQATGPLLDMPDLSVRAPDGWELRKQVVKFAMDAKAPGSVTGVQLTDQSALGDASLQEQAQISVQGYSDVRSARVMDTVTIDGVECFHVTGSISRTDQFDDYGAIHDGAQVNLHFLFAKEDFSPAERQEIIDSVLASWSWK